MSTAIPTPTPIPHPKATANRQAKALRVADFMQANPQIFEGFLTPDAVADFPAPVWALINTAMGEPNVMSPQTIAMIVGVLVGRSV